jgi:hypothetical protein
MRPLPPHLLHRGGYTRCPDTARCLTLATPVPPQAGQGFSLMAGARACFFGLVMIQSAGSMAAHGERMRSASPWLKGRPHRPEA